MRAPIKRLETEDTVFAAACIVCYYSTDPALDPLENYDVYKYSVYLSKLLFQEQVSQLPLSFYSAFSVVIQRLLECVELKKSDDLQIINSTLKAMNFINAFDEMESMKIVCGLARDVCTRFYNTING